MADAIKNSQIIYKAIVYTIKHLLSREDIQITNFSASRVNATLKENYTEFSFKLFLCTNISAQGHLLSCVTHATSPSAPIIVRLYTSAGSLVATGCTSINTEINILVYPVSCVYCRPDRQSPEHRPARGIGIALPGTQNRPGPKSILQ